MLGMRFKGYRIRVCQSSEVIAILGMGFEVIGFLGIWFNGYRVLGCGD